MNVLGRFDGHAVARQHIKVGGARESIYRRFDSVKRGLHQRPFAPPTFYAFVRVGYVVVVGQCSFDLGKRFGIRAGIEVKRHIIASRS